MFTISTLDSIKHHYKVRFYQSYIYNTAYIIYNTGMQLHVAWYDVADVFQARSHLTVQAGSAARR